MITEPPEAVLHKMTARVFRRPGFLFPEIALAGVAFAAVGAQHHGVVLEFTAEIKSVPGLGLLGLDQIRLDFLLDFGTEEFKHLRFDVAGELGNLRPCLPEVEIKLLLFKVLDSVEQLDQLVRGVEGPVLILLLEVVVSDAFQRAKA